MFLRCFEWLYSDKEEDSPH